MAAAAAATLLVAAATKVYNCMLTRSGRATAALKFDVTDKALVFS
jgi:hypothetical protein